jgi:hypothetical protein
VSAEGRIERWLPLRGSAKKICGKPGRAWVAQLVERVLGKDEVTGSIPVPGSRIAGGNGFLVGRGTNRNERG